MKRAILGTTVALSAIAMQAPAETIENITVTGTRLSQAPSGGYSSLSRDEIELINASDTAALLKHIPNLLMSRSGGAEGYAYAAIRGSEPNFILIMIDGVVVNDPTNSSGGGFDFSQLDPAIIERVDVYRGGISAIYGGDAISGVIHFITAESTASRVTVETGGWGYRRANVTLASQVETPYTAILNVAATSEDRNQFSSYQNQQAFLRLQSDGDKRQQQLLLSGSLTKKRSLAEDSGGMRFASPLESEARESEQWLASWRNEIRAGSGRVWTTSLSWSQHKEDIDNPGIREGVLSGIPPSSIESDYRKLDGELFLRWQPTSVWSLILGINAQRADGKNRGTLDFGFSVPVNYTLKREIAGAFAEGSLDLGVTTIDVGARFDTATGFEGEPSMRLSGKHELGSMTHLFAAYSEGYKLPSFFALAHPIVGNPELKPELSRNTEIGISVGGDSKASLELSVFRNQYLDLVDFDPDLFVSINRSEVIAEGAELSGALSLAGWLRVSADVSYLHTEVKDSDSLLRRRPQWSGGLQVQAEMGPLDIVLSADSRTSFYDASIATGPTLLDGYTELSFTTQWHVEKNTWLTLSIDNVSNDDFETAVGFLNPGRRVRAGITHQL